MTTPELRLNGWSTDAVSPRHAVSTRGGLTAERQQFRKGLRLQAAERFALGEASAAIAKNLRVSVRSVQRWRQTWKEGGPRALESQGPASLPRLSQKQFTQLEAEPAKGPAAHGWEDQRWTLARIKTVIGRRFHLTYTIQDVRKLLVRNGWSCQVPVRRATERNDEAVTGWAREVWPCAEDSRRPAEPGSSSRTKPDSPSKKPRHNHVTRLGSWHHATFATCADANRLQQPEVRNQRDSWHFGAAQVTRGAAAYS
nr:winged helix-turn-helix domain-containing protein [Streptomyces sp. NBC_00328]